MCNFSGVDKYFHDTNYELARAGGEGGGEGGRCDDGFITFYERAVEGFLIKTKQDRPFLINNAPFFVKDCYLNNVHSYFNRAYWTVVRRNVGKLRKISSLEFSVALKKMRLHES